MSRRRMAQPSLYISGSRIYLDGEPVAELLSAACYSTSLRGRLEDLLEQTDVDQIDRDNLVINREAALLRLEQVQSLNRQLIELVAPTSMPAEMVDPTPKLVELLEEQRDAAEAAEMAL